ncbi:NAD-dependent aldehyde dehydrogenase [Fusarium oxysporum f. sp. melonis 26406]|nr:NAD-dependent aldehyde dehydrogenase [Fusarium oxysporum f. sp. melonis 26406]
MNRFITSGRMMRRARSPLSRKFSTSKTIPLIINGKDIVTDKTFQTISPLNNEVVWNCSAVSQNHIDEAVSTANAAFPAWSKTKPSHRRDIFLSAANIMERRREELLHYLHQEMGAGVDFQNFILGLAIEGLKDTAGRIAGAVTGSVPESIHEGMRAMILKRPYGVNLGIAPWNAPFHLGLRSITFPLATGNTAILKGAELTPACYWAIADVLRDAGLPDGCLNLVFHRAQEAPGVIESLVSHPDMKKINFTGSSGVGAIISSIAGKHLKPVVMELGGKASSIVFKDADLAQAAENCARGAFFNAGQICMATERILVHSSIATEFQNVLAKTVNAMFGSQEDTPVLITSAAAKKNRALVEDAISQGAKPLDMFTTELDANTVDTKMRPVVLTNMSTSMDLYRQESFGPSVSWFAFDTEEEAIKLANDTDYGLSASIYTENLGTAFRVAEQLDSGAVHINSMTVHDEFALPHGGVKKSGFGRFNGYQGLDEFMYCKTITWME